MLSRDPAAVSELVAKMDYRPSPIVLKTLGDQLRALSEGCNHASPYDRVPRLSAHRVAVPLSPEEWNPAVSSGTDQVICEAAPVWWQCAPRFDLDRVPSWAGLWEPRWDGPAGHDRLSAELRRAVECCGQAPQAEGPGPTFDSILLALCATGRGVMPERLPVRPSGSREQRLYDSILRWCREDFPVLDEGTASVIRATCTTILNRMDDDLRWGLPSPGARRALRPLT